MVKHKAICLLLVGLAIVLNGCATPKAFTFRVSKEMFFQQVKKVAFKGVVFGYEETDPVAIEKSLMAENMVVEELKSVPGIQLIPQKYCQEIWDKSMKELNIEGFFDSKTGKIDEKKLSGFIKYWLKKVDADSGLTVSLEMTEVKEQYSYSSGYAQTTVTRMVPALAISAEIFDTAGATLWADNRVIGQLLARKSLVVQYDKTYTVAEVLSEQKKLKNAIQGAFSSLTGKKDPTVPKTCSCCGIGLF